MCNMSLNIEIELEAGGSADVERILHPVPSHETWSERLTRLWIDKQKSVFTVGSRIT